MDALKLYNVTTCLDSAERLFQYFTRPVDNLTGFGGHRCRSQARILLGGALHVIHKYMSKAL